MAKLTLSVDGKVVDVAKKYAALRGTSVSRLVQEYLRLIVQGPADPGRGDRRRSSHAGGGP